MHRLFLSGLKFEDFIPMWNSALMVAGGLVALPFILGNPLLLFGAFYAYRQYKAYKEKKEMEELKRLEGG